MREGLRPEALAPNKGKLLGQLFTRELKPRRAGFVVDALKMAEFVEEDVVQHESANGQLRPHLTPHGAEIFTFVAS
jgi:hypothetical protein